MFESRSIQTTEFKKRLISLIGNAAHYVEINTFHSYCFDLLGKIGSLEDSHDIVQRAAKMAQEQLESLTKKGYRIQNGEIRFVVAWKSDDDSEEHAIALPTLYLVK